MLAGLWMVAVLGQAAAGASAVPSVDADAAWPPPLTPVEQARLDTADDTRPPDEPAWYGLLGHVARWPDPATLNPLPDPTAVPDPTPWAELLKNPAAHRGELRLIEGRFAGRSRRTSVLRAGPWGEALTEWGVVVRDPASAAGDPGSAWASLPPVIVYLVDPEGTLSTPRAGARVRVWARFYKLWRDADAAGTATTYPVWVGRSPEVVAPPPAVRAAGWIVPAVVGLAAVLAAVLLLRRRLLPPRVTRTRRPRMARDPEPWSPADPPLPADPAEALGALHRSSRPPEAPASGDPPPRSGV
ncbi:MAG: hypothetical protein AAGG38_01460 [Planctomycetota bacterium]